MFSRAEHRLERGVCRLRLDGRPLSVISEPGKDGHEAGPGCVLLQSLNNTNNHQMPRAPYCALQLSTSCRNLYTHISPLFLTTLEQQVLPHRRGKKTEVPSGLKILPPLCVPDDIMQWHLLSQTCHPSMFPTPRNNQREVAMQPSWARAPCSHYASECSALHADGPDSGNQRTQKLLHLSATCLSC